jgi:glucose/arabinose dehydrogenase
MKITIPSRLTICTALFVCAVNATDAQSTQGPPVETNAPNSAYKPAFAGQTRIGSVKTTTPYKTDKLADQLKSPWAIVPMPDGRLLITLKGGTMEIRNADGSLAKALTGLPAVVARGQGGLLDVALDPEFGKNKIIYWSFSEKNGEANLTAVAKGKLDESKGVIENPVVIFRATPALKSSLHFGSRLAFGKDGYLYVSAGERSILEGRAQAQRLDAGLGKIFRITREGKPAPGNPFEHKQGAMPEIYAYGFRNPQGLVFDPYTNELWEAEFGPRGGDEINLIKSGKNYGWPEITYGIEYSGEAVGQALQQKDGLEQPVYYWDPVISPSGLCFYEGNAIPEWKGNLFVSGLSSAQLTRLVIKDNKVVGEERLLEDKKERIRDVACYNQMLYVVTDSGTLYRISSQ